MFNELVKNVMNLGIITADDIQRLTAIELMIVIIKRVNALMESQVGLNDELLKLKNEFDHLIETGVMTGVTELLTEWKDNGLLESLVNAQLFEDNRKLDYKLSFTPWHFSYTTGVEKPNSIEEIRKQLLNHKTFGYDGMIVMATVERLSSGELGIKEGMECLKNYFNVAEDLGIKVRCLKFHQNNSDWSTSFRSEYATLVKATVNELSKLFEFDYVTVFNEAVSLVYTDDTNTQNYVSSLCSEIRQQGYLVGITGLGFEEHLKYPYLLNCQDAIFPFDYRRIGYKDKETTYEDCRLAYEELAKRLIYYRKKLGKPIIISETGILPYWEMFRNPVYYATNDWVVDNSGKIQIMFYTYLFENKDINKAVDEVWLWYPDNMTDGDALTNCSRFFRRYLGGAM
jgi:hypothetical protein